MGCEVMEDPAQFLEENAIDCDRYHARLTPRGCASFQKRTPWRCTGCAMFGVSEHAVLANGAEGARKGRGREMSRRGDCKECGRTGITIIARGLCHVCYRKARALEDLAKEAEDKVELNPLDFNGVILEADDYETAVVDRSASDFPSVLEAVLADLRTFLIAKNAAYGNSALEPVRVFSKADPMEQIRVRIDDKLSRLFRGESAGEDTELDLLGYLTLLQVARRWPCMSAVTSVVSK